MNNSSVCSYCGFSEGIERDHVVPSSYLREKRKFEGDWTVPACGECNNTLGASIVFTVPERAAFILEKYERKYHDLIKSRIWENEELEELGYTFRTYIEQTQKTQLEIERRIRYLRLVKEMPINYLYPN